MDPLLPTMVAAIAALLLVGLVMRRLHQPHVIAYLLAGVLLGPDGLGVFTNEVQLARMGELGVVLLLFFVGMEVSLPKLAAGWRVAVLGTVLQIVICLGCTAIVGAWLDWSVARTVLIGFAISLSSTAVVLSILRTRGELDTEHARDVIGILIAQDLAVVPMLIVLGLMDGDGPTVAGIARQVLGGVLVAVTLIVVARRGSFHLPIGRLMRDDREYQVFGAFLLCFGFAWLAALLDLSTAMGAFVAGVVVHAARETSWVERSLDPFRVMLVALFFVSVGMLLDLGFLVAHWRLMLVLVLGTLVLNTLVNAAVLRVLGRRWSHAVVVGAMLAQVGEFSFVLAAVGRQAGVIQGYAYQGVLGLIVCTLVLSPAWIAGARLLAKPRRARGAPGA